MDAPVTVVDGGGSREVSAGAGGRAGTARVDRGAVEAVLAEAAGADDHLAGGANAEPVQN